MAIVSGMLGRRLEVGAARPVAAKHRPGLVTKPDSALCALSRSRRVRCTRQPSKKQRGNQQPMTKPPEQRQRLEEDVHGSMTSRVPKLSRPRGYRMHAIMSRSCTHPVWSGSGIASGVAIGRVESRGMGGRCRVRTTCDQRIKSPLALTADERTAGRGPADVIF